MVEQHSPSLFPFGTLFSAWKHRQLIFRLARREIAARYRGSLLGLAWSVLVPLMLLAVYTFVFSVIFQVRWSQKVDDRSHFALILFAGLLLYNIFAECLNRAPLLVISHAAYVKKVIFPLEVLPWVSLLTALFNAAVGFVVLLAGYVFLLGVPPWSSLFLLVTVLPLLLLVIGLSHFLAALGVYLRDVQQFIGVVTMMFMFLTPLFYPISAVPARLQGFIRLNPLTPIIEQSRAALFEGTLPNWGEYAALLFISWLISWLGFAWFMKTRKGFADVL
jgi:lipopolysaccharide transport system permease protein